MDDKPSVEDNLSDVLASMDEIVVTLSNILASMDEIVDSLSRIEGLLAT